MTLPLQIRPAAGLKNLPPVEWLVEGFIPKGSLVTLYGNPGTGKSFMALDLCMCIGLEKPWLGEFRVQQGHTLYLPVEGVPGLGQRIRAFEEAHGVDCPDNFWYCTDFESLQHPDPTRRLLLGLQQTLPEPPKLIVVDTLSRAMLGAEENSARDANIALSHIDRMRREGSTVLLIHHTSKTTDTERGSTAIRGACDTMLLMKKDDDRLVLRVDKQRDGDQGEPISMYLDEVGDSAVLSLAKSRRTGMTPEMRLVMQSYGELVEDDEPLNYTLWRNDCEAKGMDVGTFRRRVLALVSQGYFISMDEGQRQLYRRTDKPL